MDAEPAGVYSGDSLPFAFNTRERLDHLDSGSNSHLPCCDIDGTSNSNCRLELCDNKQREEQSALDLVDLLDVEDDVQDEETWLYESSKKQVFVDKVNESALKWCRRVLDNPSPETEVACRALINMLDQRSRSFLSSQSYRRPLVFHETGYTCVDSYGDQRSAYTTRSTFDSLDYNEPAVSHGSITLGYRLQDMTDVHIMARIQEDSLRQDFVSTPAASAPRSPDSSMLPPSTFNSTNKKSNADESTVENTSGASSSSWWQPPLSPTSQSSSPCQSPTSFAKQNGHSPQLARFHHEVTQFKLLKLAQNKAAAPRGSRPSTTPPLRTSLRSLQAVRISRSLESQDHQPADPVSRLTRPVTLKPQPGVSSARMGKSGWSLSLSAAHMSSSGSQRPLKDSSVPTTASKRLQSSQSISQSSTRIPHPARSLSGGGCLSGHGRVFASPERSAILAWGKNVPSTRR